MNFQIKTKKQPFIKMIVFILTIARVFNTLKRTEQLLNYLMFLNKWDICKQNNQILFFFNKLFYLFKNILF